MDAKQLKAIENIKRAVDVNDGDTLSSLREDGQVLWTASGSWSGSENVTLGDLRAIAAIAPPVAAGSVDIAELRLILIDHRHSNSRQEQDRHLDSIISFFNAWGAQQREAVRCEFRSGLHVAEQQLGGEIKRLLERAEKAEARVKELEVQLVRSRAPLSPEVQQAIAAARADGQTIAATLGGLVFLSDGTGPGEGKLDCPACGGSGHAGDVAAGGAS